MPKDSHASLPLADRRDGTSRPSIAKSEHPETSSIDRIIEIYKRDVDRTLLREQLRKTPDERVRELVKLEDFAAKLRTAGRKAFG